MKLAECEFHRDGGHDKMMQTLAIANFIGMQDRLAEWFRVCIPYGYRRAITKSIYAPSIFEATEVLCQGKNLQLP